MVIGRGLAALALCLMACGEPTGQRPAQGPPPGAVGGFSLTLPAVTLQPGEEVQPCFILPLQVDGPSRIISAASVTVGPGMHHGNLTTRPATGEGARTCDSADHIALDILAGGAVLFGSSTQHSGTEWQRFPDGMGYRVRDGAEIVARMHYLNATTAPLTVAPRYVWYTMDEAALTTELFPFAWTYDNFTIPPLSDLTVHGDCDLSGAMNVVSILPHMHTRGQRISASYLGGPQDGQDFFVQDGYGARGDTDIRLFDPAVSLSSGGLRFSCTWHNDLSTPLHYGIGDNEMCILFGYGYPRSATFSVEAGDSTVCLPFAISR